MITKTQKSIILSNLKYYFFIVNKIFILIIFYLSLVTNISAQWKKCSNGLPGCESNSNFIADSNYLYVGFTCGIWRSSNNGDSWSQIFSKGVGPLSIKGNYIFVGGQNEIFISTDNGKNWLQKDIIFLDSMKDYFMHVRAILISNDSIFVGTSQGIFLTTDNGDNWTPKNYGLPYDTLFKIIPLTSLAINEQNFIAGMVYNGVYMSTNYGNSWNPKNNGLTDLNISVLAIKDNNIFAATDSNIYLSTDNGENWILKKTINSTPWINSIYIYKDYIFVGHALGVLLSSDNGETWIEKNGGFTNKQVSSFIIKGDTCFALATYSGVYRAKLSDLGITDVKEQNNSKASIEIYPNPASSSVRLKYESSSYSKLQISIFDLLGNEVLTTSEDCNIGMNEKTIDCRSLEIGYYIIRIKQNEIVNVQPLVILK